MYHALNLRSYSSNICLISISGKNIFFLFPLNLVEKILDKAIKNIVCLPERGEHHHPFL
jgi:hypothetical protein